MLFVLAKAINMLFQLLEALIFIDVILSWVVRRENSFTQVIHIFTEPFLYPGRRIQERLLPGLPIDLSPILGIVILRILRTIVMSLFGMSLMGMMMRY